MIKRSKLVYVLGSAIIGIVSIIFIFAGLILSGVIDASSSKIVAVSSSKQVIYDGQILTCNEWEITDGKLKEGHTAVAVFSGSRKDVGESDNLFTLTVFDQNGADVSEDYEIVCQPGVLSVSARPITIQAGSEAKEYDGTPLRESSFEILSGELVENDLISADVLGEITDAGTVENVIKTTIRNAEGTDVTANYTITEISGTLTITPRKLILRSASDSKIYDMLPLTKEDYTLVQGELVQGQTIIPDYLSELTNVGVIENKFNVEILTETNTKVTQNYEIEYEYGSLEVFTKELTVETGSFSKVYDGNTLTFDEWDVTEGAVYSQHTLYVTCTGEAGNSPGKTLGCVETVKNTATYYVEDENGDDVTSNYSVKFVEGELSITKRPITIETEGCEKTYDGKPFSAQDYQYYRLTDKETGNSVLPVGDYVDVQYKLKDQIDSFINADPDGKLNEVTYTVFNAQDQDITDCYNVKVDAGQLKILPIKVAISSGSETGIAYSGTPLMKNSWDYQCFDQNGNFVDISMYGHTIYGECVGSQTTVGESENTVDWWVCDSWGMQVADEVAANYVFDEDNSSFGTLEVIPKIISVKTHSATRAYNGKALENPGYNDSALPQLCLDHTFEYIRCTARISASSITRVRNVPDIKIIDGNGNDVTSNYQLDDSDASIGVLEVYKIKVEIQTDSAEKDYDGQPFILESYIVVAVDGDILDGHTFNKDLFDNYCTWGDGSYRITPGTYNNSISCSLSYMQIVNSSDTNQSQYYSITIKTGKLTIVPRDITIQTSSASKTYDGTALYGNSDLRYNYVKDDQLVSGHTLSSITLNGAYQVEAGAIENTASEAKIVDGNGTDVTNYYNISYAYGTLQVNPRPITIQSANASKVYDGTELTSDLWTCTSVRKIIAEHDILVSITGSRTEVGESPNTISDVYIYDKATGQSMTHNYNVKWVAGSLIVKGQPSYGSLSANNGGSDFSDTNTNRDEVVARVKSDVTGRVYLKQKSEGSYTGNSWTAAPEYSLAYIQGADGISYGMDYLGGIALANSGQAEARLQIDMQQKVGYMLPYYLQQSELVYEVQKSDVRYSGGTDFSYSMYYYPYSYQDNNYVMPSVNGTAYKSIEQDYYNYVTAQYSQAQMPTSTRTALLSIVSAKGWDKIASQTRLISSIVRYVQGVATYNLDYDKSIDSSSDVVLAFLQEKEGVCRHFAATATLLLRTVGIPARYTVGFVANTKAGEYVDVTYAQAHAWVEVYIKGSGWVQLEVTGSNSGVLGEPDESEALHVYPVDQEVQGNQNTTLYANNQITGNNNFLTLINEKNYSYSVTVSGSQKGVGKGVSRITAFTLYDENGVDVTDEYVIEKYTGTLHVYQYKVTIGSSGASQVYNGTALTNNEYTILEGSLQSGHTPLVTVTGKQLNVGSSSNAFTVKIEDRSGNDVTDQYKITYSYGTLKVTKAEIIVKTGSATTTYDASSTERLTCEVAEIIGNLGANTELVVFDRAAYLNINRPGECTNIATVTIQDVNGQDVTSNYEIEYIYGTLCVERP